MAPTSLPEPQAPAAALYPGKVMHARLRPVSHRFSYRVMSLLIDLDRLREADRLSPLFAVNRAGLFSFHEADHGRRDGTSLSQFARRLAAERGVALENGRIQLLCYPRLLGYAFNPLSVYFCHRASGELALVIYEVRNTFGQIHHYVLEADDRSCDDGGLRQSQSKDFYVSPFMAMQTRYHFRLSSPDETTKIRILQTDESGPIFAASFAGHRRPLRSRWLLPALLAIPLVPFKVIAAIHWEALRLWLKGAPLVARPRSGN